MGLELKIVNNDRYIGADKDYRNSDVVIVGCPLDVTSSFRGGTRFAPDSIRRASWTLETYSPYMRRDLTEVAVSDVGNVPLIPTDIMESLGIIENYTLKFVRDAKKPLFIGGEHLITYPILKALKSFFERIQVLHFDAHWDMRDQYEGMEFCHATVMKKVKTLGVSHIFHIGVRSGTLEEFRNGKITSSLDKLKEEIDFDIPIYISFDMDVLDPSLVPGVTTPEPGGLMFDQVVEYLLSISGMEIIGADVVELAPDYDPTFVSSICAAKVVREVLMLMG